VRFDIVVLSAGQFWPTHVRDAWRPGRG
jgi:hypothetical protein